MFQTGKELDALFNVEAAFYKLEVNGRTEFCRCLATIRRRETKEETADALFVLSNASDGAVGLEFRADHQPFRF